MKFPPVQYGEYLKLDLLLNAQKQRSSDFGETAHDELLFITVHQTYELWFKQILFEIESVYNLLNKEHLPENDLTIIVPRMERVVSILKFIIGQIDILESMTPLDFLDFRDMLFPASGFQSFQFRKLETLLGLKERSRLPFNNTPYYKHLQSTEQKEILNLQTGPSLFDLVEKWLERTPFLNSDTFTFWETYKSAVHKMFSEEIKIVNENNILSEESKKHTLMMLNQSLNNFGVLFDETKTEDWPFRLSKHALQSALFINVYRDRPLLNLPFRFLASLMDIDEALTMWRYRHAQMALRMLGRKIGTGGSSGHEYLKASTEQHRVYQDLFSLTTFLIPRSKIPALPKDLENRLSAQF